MKQVIAEQEEAAKVVNDEEFAASGYSYGSVGSSSSRGNHPKGGTTLSSPAMKGRTGSHGKNLNKAPSSARSHQPKEMRSPEGRHTPV